VLAQLPEFNISSETLISWWRNTHHMFYARCTCCPAYSKPVVGARSGGRSFGGL